MPWLGYACGCRTYCIDVVDEKLELVRELSAKFTINATKEDAVEAIQRLGGVEQAIALVVSPRAFEQAYASLGRGGKLVFVALPADNEIKLPIFRPASTSAIASSTCGGRTLPGARHDTHRESGRQRRFQR